MVYAHLLPKMFLQGAAACPLNPDSDSLHAPPAGEDWQSLMKSGSSTGGAGYSALTGDYRPIETAKPKAAPVPTPAAAPTPAPEAAPTPAPK